ncbi:hypothetical protein KSP40_PGU003638 [Platanthera guangdongensis]|uniref:Uncharacterized protein n=1 Tax=Platanthera guangdongensis TaxID=2320717 RepID=A0ABR2MSS9_9ASPA
MAVPANGGEAFPGTGEPRDTSYRNQRRPIGTAGRMPCAARSTRADARGRLKVSARFLEASIKGFSIGAGLKGGLSLFSLLARLWSLPADQGIRSCPALLEGRIR